MYNEILALRVVEKIFHAFPRSIDPGGIPFQSELQCAPEELFLALDALERDGIISGGLIRTGVDQTLRAAFNINLTQGGRLWVKEQGLAALSELEALGDLQFSRNSQMAYEGCIESASALVRDYAKTTSPQSGGYGIEIANMVIQALGGLRGEFRDAYIALFEKTKEGVTERREQWLEWKFKKVWASETNRALGVVGNLLDSVGFPESARPHVLEIVMGKATDFEKLGLSDIGVAAKNSKLKVHFIDGGARSVIMGDQNINNGYSGSIGRQSTGQLVNFARGWEELKGQVDLEALASELHKLRDSIRAKSGTIDSDEVLGVLASAEKEAKQGSGPGMLSKLSHAGKEGGKWLLDQAKEIGCKIAAEALSKVLTGGLQ